MFLFAPLTQAARRLAPAIAVICSAALSSVASAQLADGTYTLQAHPSGRFVNVNPTDGGYLATTRVKPSLKPAKFKITRQTDGTYTLVERSRQNRLEIDDFNQFAFVREKVTSDYTKFFLHKQQDGTYRLQVKSTRRILHADPESRLMSTYKELYDAHSRFRFTPVVTAENVTFVKKSFRGGVEGHFQLTGRGVWEEKHFTN